MKTTCSSMALILVSLSIFASLVIAHDDAPPPSTHGGSTDVQMCWSSLKSIEGCVDEINRCILTGKVHSLSPACCKAFVAIDEACWPQMFPLDPFFPPLAESYCAAQGLATPPTPQTADSVSLSFPAGGFTDDVNQCETSLKILEVCSVEIVESIIGEKFQPPLGPGCCKTIVAINEACWPTVFPFTRFFRPMLKFYCAMKGGGGSPVTPPPSPIPAV